MLEQERLTIRAYSEFLERIKDKDMITYHEVLKILKDHIRSESDIEAVLAKS